MIVYGATTSKKTKKQQLKQKQAWERECARWGNVPGKKLTASSVNKFPSYKPPPGRETPNYQSVTTPGEVQLKQTPTYSGSKMIGIGTLHKSNGVPIFTDTEAKDISSMRR